MTETDKNKNLILLNMHKMRATCFYKSLQTEEKRTVMFSFDCQKNLALPKIPDKVVYYS